MIDELDRKLIEMLARDGRRPISSLAKDLRVSQGTVKARLDRLLEDDVVTIVALCNAVLLGMQVVRLLVKVRDLTPLDVANDLVHVKLINHVALVAGAHDIYLEATCIDQQQIIELLDELRRHPGVSSLQPIIVTHLAKDYTWHGLRGNAGQHESEAAS